jgi:hypothetical protein
MNNNGNDKHLIKDLLPIQVTCLRAACRQASADLPAVTRKAAQAGIVAARFHEISAEAIEHATLH